MGLARVTGGVLALLLVLSGGARPLAAQDAEDATVDRIVAVVGNAVILQSQVEEELFARQSQSRNPVTDPAAIAVLRRQLIDTLIDTELLFQEAIKDTTIQITPQEVSEAVDQVMRDSRRSFKSEAEFLAELKQAGFRGTDDWRRWLIEQQRRTLVIERFRNNLRNDRKLEPKNPTDKELEQFYQDIADRLPPEPAMIAMKQIIVAPQPDSASKARRRKVADSIVVELRKGADFATAARRFSQDPVSAAQGGDLGWFRQGVMVREFERAAFSLPRGTISDPVESPFGLHIIQVERIQPTEIQARHILLMPEVDTASARQAQERAMAIRAALMAGANFDSLQRLYHDPGEEKELPRFPVDSLTPAYANAIQGVPDGGISAVFMLEIASEPLRSKYGVVQVLSRTPPGTPTFEGMKQRLKPVLARRLGERAYLDGLRAKAFVEIRSP